MLCNKQQLQFVFKIIQTVLGIVQVPVQPSPVLPHQTGKTISLWIWLGPKDIILGMGWTTWTHHGKQTEIYSEVMLQTNETGTITDLSKLINTSCHISKH